MPETKLYRVFRRIGDVSNEQWNELTSRGYSIRDVHPSEYIPKDNENYTRVPMRAKETWREIVVVRGAVCDIKKQLVFSVKGYVTFFGDFYVDIDSLRIGMLLDHIDAQENYDYNVDAYPIA